MNNIQLIQLTVRYETKLAREREAFFAHTKTNDSSAATRPNGLFSQQPWKALRLFQAHKNCQNPSGAEICQETS
jgi:hypothetical protein